MGVHLDGPCFVRSQADFWAWHRQGTLLSPMDVVRFDCWMMRHLGDWIKAVGWWWTAAVGFLPSLFALSGNSWIEDNIVSPLPLATASLIVLLFASFLAYRRIAMEKDRYLDETQPRFLIRCPHLPTTAHNRLYLLDVYLVNQHQNRTLNLRFVLGALGEVEEIIAPRAFGPTPPV